MASMKQFLDKRKKTVQEETAKFRAEYDAVIAYLNSTMQKAETNCRELTDESDYDQFRKKCVPSLNWLQEQYDVILLMRSLCLPTSSELESKLDHCPDLPVANQGGSTEILLGANQDRPTEILTVTNQDRPTEVLPVANQDRPTDILPVANQGRPTEMLPVTNQGRPKEILPVTNQGRPTEILPLTNQGRPTEILPLTNQGRTTEVLPVTNQGRTTEVLPVTNQGRTTEVLPVTNQGRTTEVLPLTNQGRTTEVLPVTNQGRTTEVLPLTNQGRTTEVLPVTNQSRTTEVLPVTNQGRPTEMLPVAKQDRPKEILPVTNQGKPKEILPVTNQGRSTEVLPVTNQGKPKEILPVTNQGRPTEILPVTNQGRSTEVLPVANQDRPTEMLPVANQGRPTEILPVTKQDRPTEILPVTNQGRPTEILPVTNEDRPTEIKEHWDEASVYGSALSDTSNSKEKPCLVSSFLVTGPNLPVDIVSPAPDTAVENYARSTAGSVVSSLVSEPAKTKRSLEISYAIPKYKICDATVDVMATMIISPFLIWVQVKPRACELEDLLEALTSYHKKLKREDPDYRLHSKPQVGQLVSAQFTQDDMWYRAYVLAVFELPAKSGLPGKKRLEMDVGYVDYGNTERLPLSRVRPLPEKFHKLPYQSFLCSLSKIGPVNPTGFLMWSDDIIENFRKMDCTQLLTVRFSKPLPGCPIMFFDILNSKHLGSSKDGRVSTENAETEKMIVDGHAVRMPDNKHVAKWYRETYSKDTQPVNPGEKMVASLMRADNVYAHMPILDVDLFETPDFHSAQTGKSFLNSDRSQHHLKNQHQLSSMPSANSGQPQLTKLKTASPQTLDKSRPSLNYCQPLLPKLDKLQQSVNDLQVESQKEVDGGQPPTNKSQALLQNDPAVNQSVLNVCPVFERKGSHSETRQKLETYAVSSDLSNDFQKNSYYGASEEVSTSRTHSKVLCQARLEAVNSSGGMIADFGQRNVSGQDQTTSSGTFMNAAQSSVVSSSLREVNSSSGKMDSVAGRRVNRTGSRNSFQQSAEGVPLSLDGPAYSGSTLSRPPSSSCSLQDQKFNETKAYVEALASSGWPEKIARSALRHNEDESGNGYHEDLAISPSSDTFTESPLKSEFGNTDNHDEDLKQNWVQESEQEQVQRLEQNITPKPDQAQTKQYEREQDQEVTWTVSLSRVVVPNEGYIRVVMSHLQSPSRFWVHLINENASIIDYIGDELKRHYADLSSLDNTWHNETMANDKVLHDYGICCVCSSVDCELYRAEVISHDKNQKCELKVKVFYVDFGNTEWIDTTQMLPLPPSLLSIPPLAIRCSLDGVEPVLASDESSCHWSQDAIDVFTDLCGFTRELHGHFRSQVKPGDAFYVSRDRPLRLQLEIPDEDEPEDINEQLVMRGLARPAKQRHPTREDPVQPEMEDEMDNWDPMAEDFLSHRNSYKVDVDDPGVATVNYKAQDEQRICKFFRSKNSQCWKGDNCPYEHISYGGVVTTTDRREVFSVCDDELQPELPSVGSWVVVSVTCMIDPSHFFVVLPFGSRSLTENPFDEKKPMFCSQHDEGYDDRIPSPTSNSRDSLEYLMDCLQEFYRSKVYADNDLTVYAEGENVVVRFTQDERWHRAKIVGSDPENNRVQVLYVDFGNKEWVDNERVRQIQERFLDLPFQAVECRLPLCANNDSGKIWSDMAKKLFLDLTGAQFLVARVVQRGPGPLLYVELFNTRDRDVNINKTLLMKGHARKPDRILIPCSQHHKTSSPKRGTGLTFKDQWVMLPG